MGEVGVVVHVVEATFAGVGRHVLDLAKFQSQQGHLVHVIYGVDRESSSFRREREALDAITWHPAQLARGLGISDLKEMRRLDGLLREIDPDVVHGHSTKGGIVARTLAHRASHVSYTPNAVYSMNPLLPRVVRGAVGVIELLLAMRTSSIIAVSPEEESHLRSLRIPGSKISLVPNGVGDYIAPPAHEVRVALSLPLDIPLVGFVGRLDEQKSPLMFIDVCEVIAQQSADAQFVLIGDGPMRSDVELAIATTPALRDRIHVLGEHPGRWAMAAFDVFLLPSRYEGFPYVLIEAAAQGLPIVTTDRACASAIVRDGITGVIAPYESKTALAEGVLWALDADRAAVSALTRDVAAGYSLERMAGLPYSRVLDRASATS